MILEIKEFATERGIRSLPGDFLRLGLPPENLPIQLFLVLIVISECGINLGKCQVGMFTLYFLGSPTIGDFIANDLNDLGIRTGNPCHATVINFNMGCNGRRHR